MHLYNAWLPPPVAEETKREKEAFAGVVKSVQESYNPGDPESVYATLKWMSLPSISSVMTIIGSGFCFLLTMFGNYPSGIVVPILIKYEIFDIGVYTFYFSWNNFVKAKSELSIEDVSTIVEVGLELFQISEHKLHAQMSTLDDNVKEGSLIPSFQFSEWLDEFFYRLFSLLQHLEPSSVLTEGVYSPTTSGTFLVEDGPYYFCMLEILLGRLSDSLYKQEKSTLSPALEIAIEYQLKVLSVAISYGGPALLGYRELFKEVIASAFDSTSWKVNGAGDHVLRSLLGSLVHYYPIDHYKCVMHHSFAPSLEEWIDTKDFSIDKPVIAPRWHVPVEDEISFANELLEQHFESALDDLLMICQSKIHSDPGDEKDHLKVTLLRVDSSLQGVLSCLPDFRPSSENGMVKEAGCSPFLIAGATGSCVGSSELREKAADVIHETCRYLLKEKSDDSILLLLLIRVMDTLGNYGSSEYEEWSNHRQSWKLESAAIIEPPINFIVSSHSKGKRRPRWALVDKAYMHNTWRSSQSSYHLFRTSGNVFPSNHAVLLMDDLLNLSLHSYETVRRLAAKSILKMMNRWPSTISKCVLTLAGNLRDPNLPENAVLGSCAVLSSQTVLKRLTTDRKALSSFLLGILFSSHNESQKAQKAITEVLADTSCSSSYFA
ncbi:UNVERIFIED_CONTAM: Proteasome activator subunit [Sesamum radiatum]|uniref:Proteasome activator subunit n=1 Tax=Sesamum radiatum TaxID=300843 RepID=A0AAW2T3L3_SESRA